MGPGGRKKEKVTHKDVCTAVGKISAYLRCGDTEKAKQWAAKLVDYLRQMDLLPVREKDDLY